MSTFREQFEAVVPDVLQVAYDFVDHDDAVETIWVVADRDGDWASAFAAYEINGTVVPPGKVSDALPGLDDSADHQGDLTPIATTMGDLLLSNDPTERAANPTRIV